MKTDSKVCNVCEKLKSLEEFHGYSKTLKKTGRVVLYRQQPCKDCLKLRNSPPRLCAVCGKEWKATGNGRLCDLCRDKLLWCTKCAEFHSQEKFPPSAIKNGKGACAASLLARHRLIKYNLTGEGISALLGAQGEKCAICFRSITVRFHVDHDHVTGKVRGLLCRHCNIAIGLLQDSSTVVSSAAAYLGRHNK